MDCSGVKSQDACLVWLEEKMEAANKQYSLQESYCGGVLAESRKELAGVGAGGGKEN